GRAPLPQALRVEGTEPLAVGDDGGDVPRPLVGGGEARTGGDSFHVADGSGERVGRRDSGRYEVRQAVVDPHQEQVRPRAAADAQPPEEAQVDVEVGPGVEGVETGVDAAVPGLEIGRAEEALG